MHTHTNIDVQSYARVHICRATSSYRSSQNALVGIKIMSKIETYELR